MDALGGVKWTRRGGLNAQTGDENIEQQSVTI
jgi:hypothetical protein